MPRYIDADELLRKSILRITGHWDLPHGGAQNFSAIPDTVIMNFPTADVAPVVHAEWKKCTVNYDCDYAWECTNCKELFVLIDGTPKENKYNFCPNCGAKMDGGAK